MTRHVGTAYHLSCSMEQQIQAVATTAGQSQDSVLVIDFQHLHAAQQL